MDMSQLRKLNNKVINANAKVARAELALRLAKGEQDQALANLNEGVQSLQAVPTLSREEQDYCREGRKILAIKSLRERTWGPGGIRLGLKEAKDIVDAWSAKNVSLVDGYRRD